MLPLKELVPYKDEEEKEEGLHQFVLPPIFDDYGDEEILAFEDYGDEELLYIKELEQAFVPLSFFVRKKN